ncbi:MAG: zinc ribbon domain-containing protein [Anaerolineae bacterium]|nr:zinc ribbon domain-containing protein [Anaerolineae bacterium]
MPIYEYYCAQCDGWFSHLARQFDAPPPPCPRCGSLDVQKIVSQVNALRSEAGRLADLEARAEAVDRDNPQEMAQFLQETGSLLDEVAPVDPQAFQEIVARRAQGAQDADLEDVADAIPFEGGRFVGNVPSPYADIPLPQTTHHGCTDCGHDHDHDHDHHHDHVHEPSEKKNPRRAKDLGWG